MFFNLTTLSNCSRFPNNHITFTKSQFAIIIEPNRLHHSPSLGLKGGISVSTKVQHHRLPVKPSTLPAIGAVDGN